MRTFSKSKKKINRFLLYILPGILLFFGFSPSEKRNNIQSSEREVKTEHCTVIPIPYNQAVRNPLMGFTTRGIYDHPWATTAQTYIRWNDIENRESDNIEKIKNYCDSIWSGVEEKNIKVIPRVYLHWTGDKKFWPVDMQEDDYTSEEFQRRVVRLIERLGECWDNDPRVAFVEMGIFGKWGEHHSPYPTPEIQKIVGDAFVKAFKNKKVTVRRMGQHFTDYSFGQYWDSWAHYDQMFLQGKFKMIPYWHHELPSPYPKYFPVYNDEYLKWWGELVELSGKQFDSHPLLEYTDISGYGFWGEMHHWAKYSPDGIKENYFPGSQEVLDKCLDSIIKSYLNAFPLTPTALCLAARFFKPGVEAYKKGLVWPRRDSFQTSYSIPELMLSQGLTKGVGMIWEIIIPGVSIQTDEQRSTEFKTVALPQRYYDVGSHYAAMGFNPWDAIFAHENCLLSFHDIQRQIGYKIRPSMIWKRKNDKHKEELVLGLCNDGCVGVPGQLTVHCKFSNQQVVSLDLPLGEPESRNIKPFILPIPETIITQNTSDGCELSLSLKMKGKVFPVKWAVSKKQVKDPDIIQVNWKA